MQPTFLCQTTGVITVVITSYHRCVVYIVWYFNDSFLITYCSVEQKLSNDGSRYNVVEAQAIVTELREIQQSLSSGQRERTGLMHSLAKLKDDLTRLQLCSATDDPDLQTQHSSSTQLSDKLSTASQTDLSGEVCDSGIIPVIWAFDKHIIIYPLPIIIWYTGPVVAWLRDCGFSYGWGWGCGWVGREVWCYIILTFKSSYSPRVLFIFCSALPRLLLYLYISTPSFDLIMG